jgi:thiol-disulfide isomerase/thioredoxin
MAATLFAFALFAQSITGLPGSLWDATVTVDGVEIPFRIELHADSGSFFNGDEKVTSTSGSFENGALVLHFDHYATTLEASLKDGVLEGSYLREGKAAYPFHAKPFSVPAKTDGDAPSIAGLWDVAVNSAKGELAWKLIVRQSGSAVSGAILRVDGDTGTIEGAYRNGKFVLSHFSGARPLLLEITPNNDGSLTIVQNAKTTLTAVRSDEARAKGLPAPSDPSRYTSVADPTEPFRFHGKDLTGREINQDSPRFQGKVVLVSIMGSWCPNCHDEAPFLAELDRRYRDKGLEIVALSFEEAAQLANPTRLRAFIRQYGIHYTVLLAGEPSEAKDKLPQAVNLNTWPATFFLGRDGLVRGVHAGFASAASGEAHAQLKEEIVRTVEQLLATTLARTRPREDRPRH